jgi:hypothetical protein
MLTWLKPVKTGWNIDRVPVHLSGLNLGSPRFICGRLWLNTNSYEGGRDRSVVSSARTPPSIKMRANLLKPVETGWNIDRYRLLFGINNFWF